MAAIMYVGLLFTFLCYPSGRYSSVEGCLSLSEHENFELEKQLKLLNKPAIKTIETRYGQIYDCVDFYKQPAFDHPLLKNHSYHFQMEPEFPSENVDEIMSEDELLHDHRLLEGGCPVGTVPIKRVTKEDLIREKFASKQIDFGGNIVVVARTDGKFTGALGFLSLYNPPVQEKQYSAARIKIQNGNDFIQFGWRVDRTLYGDGFTHLFIQTNTTSGKCFDARCGFVITRRDLAPGLTFQPSAISVPPKFIKETKLRVQRDKDGSWWLSVGPKNSQVGFWPANIFSLAFATYVDWGGEVDSPRFVSAPPMGNGFRPVGDTQKDAYICFVTGIDINGKDVNVDTEMFVTATEAALLYDGRDETSTDPVFGHLVFFGWK